jgi:hypothetical protein
MIKIKGVGGQCKTVWDYIVGRMGILESFDPMFSVSALLRIRKKGRGPGATTPRWSGPYSDRQLVSSQYSVSQHFLRTRKKGDGPAVTTPRWSGQPSSGFQPISIVLALSQDQKKGRGSWCHYSPLVRTDN